MATNQLNAFNGYYGYGRTSGSYGNAGGLHLYVGAENTTTKYDYRSRITFNKLSSISAIGSNKIRITKITLHLYRNSGGTTTIKIGCSNSSKWGASLAASKTAKISSSARWHTIDITSFAPYIMNYTGNWYIHMMNGNPRVVINGPETNRIPYIKVTWEYVAATISSNSDESDLGNEVIFSVNPEVDGETHTLTYSIGDQYGTIATKAGDSISWIPPLDLATEFPAAENGTVTINMTAYNASGAVIRTEVLYQSVRAPDSMSPSIENIGLSMTNALNGYALADLTKINLTPMINMDSCFGSTPSSVVAEIDDGSVIQQFSWTSFDEIAPGIYSGQTLTSATFSSEGNISVDLVVTDSRGRTVDAHTSIDVLPYTPPVISEFSVERYEPTYDENEEVVDYIASDLGGYVWVNMHATICPIAPEGVQINTLSWIIDGIEANGNTVHVEGTGNQILNIDRNTQIFPDPVGEGEVWQYTLTILDSAGNTAIQYSVVSAAHVGVSMSPDKFGFAIGMIANGNKTNPMFEVAKGYESHFYGGIAGVTNYSEAEGLTGGTWIDGKPIYCKVVRIPAVAKGSTSANGDNPTAIINASVDTLIDARCVLARESSTERYLAPYWKSTADEGYASYVHFDLRTGAIIVRTGAKLALSGGHVILLYTKK